MLIEEERIAEQTEAIKDGESYIERVKKVMLKEQYPFFVERIIKEVGFGPGKALEIGTGPLPMGFSFCKQTQWAVTGIDISEDVINLGRREMKADLQMMRYKLEVANAEQMPFADESFNLVFSSGSLHHWNNPMKVFKEINRVLAVGGTAVIFDLNREFYGNEKELVFITESVQPQFRSEFIASLKAAYLPKEIYELLRNSDTLHTWNRIQFEQYREGLLQLSQCVILKKKL